MDRFYCPELAAGELALPEAEGRHAWQVLRKSTGDRVELFDGAGRRAAAELVSVHKKAVVARAEEPTQTPAAPPLTVAAAVPKADRFKWMVEKLTELGVTTLVPLKTERTVVDPGAAKLEKMAATVVAACKQSGRDRLMAIEPVTDLASALARPAGTRLIADVGASGRGGGVDTLLLVGPEGGWTDAERAAAAEAGFEPVTLGPHVLRTETAAVAGAAVLAG